MYVKVMDIYVFQHLIIGKKRLNGYKNEAKHLREDIENSKKKIKGITKRKEDVTQDVLKTQKLLNEYK